MGVHCVPRSESLASSFPSTRLRASVALLLQGPEMELGSGPGAFSVTELYQRLQSRREELMQQLLEVEQRQAVRLLHLLHSAH